jgi:hemerythrin
MVVKKEDLVTWTQTFSVGVQIIDDQHKTLFRLINDMYHHSSGDEWEEREYFKEVIHESVKYIKIHFSTEEKIMVTTKYPGYGEHKKEHDLFVLTVIEKVKDFEAGKRLILANFTKFLKEWILTHIAVKDKLYISYFKSIASRKSDGTLSISSTDIA